MPKKLVASSYTQKNTKKYIPDKETQSTFQYAAVGIKSKIPEDSTSLKKQDKTPQRNFHIHSTCRQHMAMDGYTL